MTADFPAATSRQSGRREAPVAPQPLAATQRASGTAHAEVGATPPTPLALPWGTGGRGGGWAVWGCGEGGGGAGAMREEAVRSAWPGQAGGCGGSGGEQEGERAEGVR